MHVLLHTLTNALLMVWQTFWALAFGFSMSAFLQVFVRRESIMEQFGQTNLRSVGLATFLGAVSSSCSYAATAAARTAFKKGAGLVPSLAFMFASTNLVLELGFVLWLFLGWRFVLAEGVGAFVLIGLMWVLVRFTLSRQVDRGCAPARREGGRGRLLLPRRARSRRPRRCVREEIPRREAARSRLLVRRWPTPSPWTFR